MNLQDILHNFHPIYEIDPRDKKRKIKIVQDTKEKNKEQETKYKLIYTKRYNKHLDSHFSSKRYGTILKKISFVTPYLENNKGYTLPATYNFHFFADNKNTGDVHLLWDVVLVFTYDWEAHTLTFDDIGSHNETGIV